ncbi:hypothetical protein F4604DRAFT_842810 [Suillus subluteus]|nr:hypothetical protein F4604DRAFT_842810 [Suillus subluteus]
MHDKMYNACRVLHKLLAILRTMVIKLSRQISYPYYILQRILSTWTSRLVHSSAANTIASNRRERHEQRGNEPDISPVPILPSLNYPSESGHSVSQRSEHTRTRSSLPEDVQSNYVSVSVVTSLRDSAPPILKPMTASDVRRYSKKSQIQRTDTAFMIPAGRKDFSIPDKIDAGDLIWDCQIHPHGTLYFSSEQVTWRDPEMETTMVQITVFTDTDAQIAGHLEDTLTELTVDLCTNTSGELECKYYFVAPDRRALFWENDFEAMNLFGEVRGVTNGHIKYAMEAEYW